MLQLSDLTLEDIFLKITMGENDVRLEPNERPRINLKFEESSAEEVEENGGNE